MTRFCFTLLLAFCLVAPGRAQNAPSGDHPFLSAMFADNMVLQRDQRLPFWGWTTPGRTVTVSAQGKTARATADAGGYWKAVLPALALGRPLDVSVTGPQSVTLHNVLVGDVWVCSGQSNMEFGLGNAVNAEREIAAANFPQIRLFTVQKKVALEPQTGLGRDDGQLMGRWSVCTPQTVRTGGWNGFSAVGYFFGRNLHQTLHIPIGLIHTSWGGTPAEAWASAQALQSLPDFRPALAQLSEEQQARRAGGGDFSQRLTDWYAKNDPGSASPSWADAALDAASWKTMTLPALWEQAGTPALAAFDGIVWFRREVTLPDGAAGRAATLNLGPIDDNDTTWVNGTQVGATNDFTADRNYHVPAGVLKPGRNVIAVRVLDTGGGGGLYGKPEQMHLDVEGRPAQPLAGAWTFKAGPALAGLTPAPQRIDGNQNFPSVLFNGMIAPVAPFGVKGAIWYQGESNVGRAAQYRTLLSAMIGDWRAHWGEGNFPFYIVQLANFNGHPAEPSDDPWAGLQEAQQVVAQTVPNAGYSVTNDIGDAGDIHPKNKQEVGRRLALVALAKTYGKPVEYSGPQLKSVKRAGNTLRLSFTHLGGGLVARGSANVTGFAVAGPDGKFVWATAGIDGDTVVVSAPGVPNPVSVRYAWAANPICNLYNKAGLPASAFRAEVKR